MKTYVWHAQGGDYGGKFCGEVYAPTLEEASQKACAALDYEVQCSDCWSDEGESLVYSLRVEGPPECAWCDGDPVGLDEAGDAACAEHAVACGPLPEPEPWDAWEDLVTVDVDPDHDALIAAARTT